MALALALLGVLLALLALLVAVRTERHVRRLALALAREWGLSTGAERARGEEARSGGEREEASRLRGTVEALEQQVHALEARLARAAAALPEATPLPRRPLPAGEPAPGAPRERIEAHLRALGYDDVVVLAGPAGGFLYEAREEGMPRKGAARVAPDGRVTLGPSAQVRVFP